ncbi:MAG: ABC transporter ATP-binding protein [Epulopiscium sp.]|nr:ABC transporter ATP-binding protein [Candidatus Epulonipiscium sp.]
MKNIESLKPYLKKYAFHFLFGLIALVIVDVLQLFIPEITGQIADGWREGTLSREGLYGKIGQIFILTIGIVLGRFVWRYFIFGTSRKIEYHMRNDLFAHWETLSLRYFTENKTGDLMAHATNDLTAVRSALGSGLMMAFDALILTSLVIVRMATRVHPKLTMVAIIPLPLIAIGGLLFGISVRKRFKEKQDAFAQLTDHVQENFSGIRVIKAFVQETKEIQKFEKVNQYNFEKNMRLAKLFALMMPLAGGVAGLSMLIVMGYGGYLAMIGDISLGGFIIFIQYLEMLIWPMMALGWCINILSQGMASQQRIQTIMNEKPDIYDRDTVQKINSFTGKIEIKKLTFSYPRTKEPALKNITVKVEPGQTLALLGRTGSGKTTLMNLILRLYDPPKNTILIDGVDILDIPLRVLRKNIGYVPQDNFLFSDTIARNIAFGKKEATIEEIQEAAKRAKVHENIMNFPKQYDTVVGERGVTLSGGQKQRVSMARAFIKDPAILILDDSLSAVDTQTEEEILYNLYYHRKKKTNIMIAHRISTIQRADLIVVLEEGNIIEQGNHHTLLEQKGMYYEMYKKQLLEKQLEEV